MIVYEKDEVIPFQVPSSFEDIENLIFLVMFLKITFPTSLMDATMIASSGSLLISILGKAQVKCLVCSIRLHISTSEIKMRGVFIM